MAKESKELVNSEQLEQYQAMSGELSMTGTKLNLPIIKIDYEKGENYGRFVKGIKNNEGQTQWTALGESFEAVRLVTRKTLRAYVDEENTMYTPEYDNPNEILQIFSRGNMLLQGTAKDLRKNYTDSNGKCSLKMNIVMYLLLDQEIVRMYIKGASLASLFNFFQKIKFPKDAVYNTLFTLHPDKKGSINYFVIDYAMGSQYKDIKKVLEVQKELRLGFKFLKEMRENKGVEYEVSSEHETIHASTPAIDQGGDEIDVSKIPF